MWVVVGWEGSLWGVVVRGVVGWEGSSWGVVVRGVAVRGVDVRGVDVSGDWLWGVVVRGAVVRGVVVRGVVEWRRWEQWRKEGNISTVLRNRCNCIAGETVLKGSRWKREKYTEEGFLLHWFLPTMLVPSYCFWRLLYVWKYLQNLNNQACQSQPARINLECVNS